MLRRIDLLYQAIQFESLLDHMNFFRISEKRLIEPRSVITVLFQIKPVRIFLFHDKGKQARRWNRVIGDFWIVRFDKQAYFKPRFQECKKKLYNIIRC